MKVVGLTRLEKIILIGMCIEAATGVVGGSLILVEGHPYLTLAVCALGAVGAKVANYLERKINAQMLEEAKLTPLPMSNDAQ